MLNISKTARVNSTGSKPSTWGFVNSTAVATGGAGNKTVTAGSDGNHRVDKGNHSVDNGNHSVDNGNHSVDSWSLTDQLSKMKSLLNNKLGKLNGKIGASESNFSAQITGQLDSLQS